MIRNGECSSLLSSLMGSKAAVASESLSPAQRFIVYRAVWEANAVHEHYARR